VHQRSGRGLRKGGHADRLQIHDFIDATHKSLLDHSEHRISEYSKNKSFTIHIDEN